MLAAFAMLYPLLWMIGSSFKPDNLIFSEPGLIPSTWDFSNYTSGWNALRVSFTTFYANSFLIAALAVIGNLSACSLTAFAFARLEFRFKWFWFALMMGTLMLPYHVTLVPQYILFLNLGWVNTFLPLVVPRFLAVDAFFIFLMVQFFRGIPREIDEAAIMDGCGPWRIYWRIMLPLSHAGAGDGRDLLLHLDLRRFPRAADLSERHAAIHRAAGAARLHRFERRRVALRRDVRHVDAVAGAGLRRLPGLPEPHHPRRRPSAR